MREREDFVGVILENRKPRGGGSESFHFAFMEGSKVVGPPAGLGFRRNSRRERAREARAPGLDSSESGAHLPRGSDVVGPGFSPLTLAGPDHRRAHSELPSVFHFALRLRFFLVSFPVA